MHSASYRKPEDFAGKTVVVLGASYSGRDIAIEICKYGKKVYLSHRHEKYVKLKITIFHQILVEYSIDDNAYYECSRIQAEFPSNLVQVRGIIKANGNTLILQDNTTIDDANSIVYATGYSNYFPFLDSESGITIEKNHVKPLYRHMINIEYPSMFFIGLPQTTNIYSLVYTQVNCLFHKFLITC